MEHRRAASLPVPSENGPSQASAPCCYNERSPGENDHLPRALGGFARGPFRVGGDSAQVKEKLQDELRRAMKARERTRVMTLRGLLAEITRLEKDVRRPAEEAEIVRLVQRERARREEALEFARRAGRADLVAQNEEEARVLNAYLPTAPSSDELRGAIAEQVAAGVRQIGPIMKALRERFGAGLDGKLASELIKEALASN